MEFLFVIMEFSENFESFGHFNNDPFCNLLDEEIPQNIFDELMNDVNCSALGFDMNSVSSEDSGRSSSSYDDLGSRIDTFTDQAMTDMPQIKTEIIKHEEVDDDPKSPSNFIVGIKNQPNQNTIKVMTSKPVEKAQPVYAMQQTYTQIQQPQFVLSQPKIVVKQEPIKIHTQSSTQQIFTLQSIDGQQFVVTNANQTPVHTIVNGTTGILKIPIVPVTGIPITTTQKTAPMPTIALQPSKQTTVKPNIIAPVKTSKKSGHNIIERRYRTSIVIITTFFLAFLQKILHHPVLDTIRLHNIFIFRMIRLRN